MPRLTRKDFQVLAELRANEADALAQNGNEQGAYYLGGIAIECALKACIARKTREHDFPPKPKEVQQVYSHDLTELLSIADLKDLLDRDMRQTPDLAANWGVVKTWTAESRYTSSGLRGRDMSAAITGPNGVLWWIRQHW